MKLFISKIYATILAFWHGGYIIYRYINKKGYWEFEICFDYGFISRKVLYRTKGLRW